ncbi:unnamed protein product [Absidia cylindrospora]
MMIQTVDIPELPLATQTMKKTTTSDDLFSMWNVYSKCKHSMENAKRLENLSWRLWHHESFQHYHQDAQSILAKVSPTTTIVPSSVIIISSLSSHSTFGPQTPPGNPTRTSCSQQHRLPEMNHHSSPASISSQQKPGRRTNKFYVDESDDEEDEMDDTIGESESCWSTVHDDDHYLEEAYQRNQPAPVLSPSPPRSKKENPDVYAAAAAAAPLDFSPPSPSPATNQNQPCSLLSRLIQSSPHPPPPSPSTTMNDILPPQLQSCVDWEKSQNSIRYRLGCSLDLPDENIIW